MHFSVIFFIPNKCKISYLQLTTVSQQIYTVRYSWNLLKLMWIKKENVKQICTIYFNSTNNIYPHSQSS